VDPHKAYLKEALPRLKRMKIAFLHDYGSDREIVEDFNLRWKSLAFAYKVSTAKAVYEAVQIEEYLIHYLTE
tara:strand:+ start:30 stop:245 length:216 start_codon:yes stop_codon:yes gene_type:complete